MNISPRILIVEDDAVLVIDLQNTLAQMGYQVAGMAATGEDAVALAVDTKPDAILMDINLRGGMNGIQAAEKIHQQQDTPIIYLTAYTDETLLQQAKVTDAYAYLAKPVRERELRASLEMALYKYKTEQRVRHLNQVLRAVRDVNQLITREHNARQLMEEACQILLRTRGYCHVWVCQSAENISAPLAFAGKGSELLKHIIATATPEQGKRMPSAEAFNTRKVVICADMQNDERYTPWQEEFEKFGFHSAVAVPLLHEEDLFGVLVVYAEQVNFFSAEEIDLLFELAGDIAFGLKSIAKEMDRELMTDALHRSEAKFRAVVDNSSDGIIFGDANAVISYRSPSYSRINGYSDDERVGRSGFETVHPDDMNELRRYWAEVVQSPGIPLKIEYRIQHKNGAWLWVETTSQNLLNNPDIREIVVAARNITERKYAEEALRNSENKFSQAFHGSPGIFAISAVADGRFIDVNDSFLQFAGYAREEVIGRSVFDLSLWADPEQGKRLRIQLQEQGYVRNFESTYRRKTGELGYGLVSAAIINVEGQPCLLTETIDITERKRAEEIQLASEQAARELAEQLQMVNQISISLTAGLDMDRLLQTLYEQCQHIGDTDAFYVALYEEATGVLTSPFNYKDGERRPFVPRRISENAGVVGQIIETRQALYLPDMQTTPPDMTIIREAGIPTRSYVGIPLILNERVVGVLSVQSHKPNAYTSEQIRTLELLATQIAIAIQNSQLYEQVQREKNLADAVIEHLPGAFCLIDQQMRMARWNHFAKSRLGYSDDEVQSMNPLDMIEESDRARIAGLIFQTFESGQANTETQLVPKNGEPKIPIYINGARVQFGSKLYLLVMGIDISERKQREHELLAIASLSTALRTASTRADMLPVIVQQLVSLLNADAATIEIIDPQTGDVTSELADGVWKNLTGARQKKNTGINALISKTLQPYHTHDLEHDPNLTFPEWAREGIRGAAGVPLIAQEKLIGFIWAGRRNDMTQTEVGLLSAIADIAANAIHRATLHEQTQKNAADLELAYNTTLEGWAHALELRDQETEGHSLRVVEQTVELARLMGVSEDDLENIRRGALLHDIGKMGIPDSILLKPGSLDEREWETMRRHPIYAFNLLNRIGYLRPALDIPYCHHEKWDGSGYPRGLKGEEIPLSARLFAIVDVWDAVTNDRPYRPAWSADEAMEYISQQSGKHFDPKVVEIFLKSLNTLSVL